VKLSRQFADAILQVLRESSGLRIQAGSGDHRFIGIWHVVVKERLFVRSWSVKETGWFRTLFPEAGAVKGEPHGVIQVKKHEIVIAARQVADTKTRNAIDRAYLEKYKTPGALNYAKDLCSAKSRATTTELIPTKDVKG